MKIVTKLDGLKKRPNKAANRKYSYKTKVVVCADYLLGVKLKVIEYKYNIPHGTVRT